MKADPQAQRRLLELQDVDVSLAQLMHRAKTLPEHAKGADVSARRGEVEERLVAAETRVSDLHNEQERAEQDLIPVRERLQRNQANVDAGGISDPKSLTGMLEEIKSLTKRISDLEDVELKIMEQLDQATLERNRLAEERIALAAEAVEINEAKDAELARLKGEVMTLKQQRTALVTDLPPTLVELYEKIAGRSGGLGAAALEGGRCMGCRLEATASDLTHYRDTPADEVVRCEECGRILVRA